MRMSPTVVGFGLLTALCFMLAGPATASDNSYMASVAAAVDSAATIEAWRLSCRGGVESAVARVADLDSTARARLAAILRAGSRDTAACYETRCTFCPGYRLVVHDREPAITMMVTRGCTGWLFTRAGVRLANEGSCFYLPDGLIEPTRALMVEIYGAEPKD
jgi:hypothetical protein